MIADDHNQNHYNSVRYGVIAALFSAALFGMSTPMAKMLLGEISPLPLAGLLYLGSGIGLFFLVLILHLTTGKHMPFNEPKLKGSDYLYLAGVISCGGVAAPIFLIYGLFKTSGSMASLLLSIESILTTLVASLIFREWVGRRVWMAAAIMFAGSSILTYMPGPIGWSLQSGSILVILACLLWAFDNNLTRRLSHRNPFFIALAKGLAAGFTTLAIAFAAGNKLPSFFPLTGALILGALSYGASLVLFVYALRYLGTSRTSIYFGIAPFLGAAFSIVLLCEPITLQMLAAALFMLTGTGLVLKECHKHEHEHEVLSHEHRHIHDEHHNHEHGEGCQKPHCHKHEHGLLVHSHAHVPDLHHYHCH